MTHRGDHGGAGDQTDAGHAQQCLAGRALFGELRQLLRQLPDASLHQPDLFQQQAHRAAQHRGNTRLLVGDIACDLGDSRGGTFRHEQSELAAEPAQRVDAPGARALPRFPRAMQGLQRLLLDRFHSYRLHIGSTHGLQQRGRVRRVGLVALHVGPHILSRQQLHLDASLLEQASPVVGRAARFHDDELDRAIVEPTLELHSAQPLTFIQAEAASRLGLIQALDGESMNRRWLKVRW